MKAARENGWDIHHVRAIRDPDTVYNDVIRELLNH